MTIGDMGGQGHVYRGCGRQEDRDTAIGDVGGGDMGVGIWGRRIWGRDYRGCGDTRRTGTRL